MLEVFLVDVNVNSFRIVRSLTDDNKEESPRLRRARTAGKLGGPARAAALSSERRREISVNAVRARWAKRAR